MNPAADLIERINSDRITTGVLVTDHLWPRLIEICKLARLDYAIIDCEHGPYDLSAELGCCWQPDHERLQSALAQIRAAGRNVGKNMWMIGNGPALARQGYTFLCVGEPSAVLAQQLGQIVKECAKIEN